MADVYTPELLALLRQMQEVARNNPVAADIVAKVDPDLMMQARGLSKPSGAPTSEPFMFTNNPDQRLYQQELAKSVNMPQGQNPPTLAEIMLYKKQMDNQPRQAVAMLPEDE